MASAYLARREQALKESSFSLDEIGGYLIDLGRSIRRMPGWDGLYPPLREFMQNTIDHLELLNPETGLGPRPAVKLDVRSGGGAVTYDFSCGVTNVCSIVVEPDSLTIEQAFTHPLHPGALDSGVVDKSKQNATAAGGFGDGFKSAIVVLLAHDGPTPTLRWTFEAADRTIT
ncbi:hypothetical protein T492DRAFT_892588, partial [Pavlovales sp. CCMP2436]